MMIISQYIPTFDLIVSIPSTGPIPHVIGPFAMVNNEKWTNPPTDPAELTIDLDGVVPIGDSRTTEFFIPEAGEERKVQSGFVFGLGQVTITATVQFNDEAVSYTHLTLPTN